MINFVVLYGRSFEMPSPLRQVAKEFNFRQKESTFFYALLHFFKSSPDAAQTIYNRIKTETTMSDWVLVNAVARFYELAKNHKSEPIVPCLASDMDGAERMKREGKDPIIVRANEHEVYVFTQSEEVSDNIWLGANWSSWDGSPEDPYERYIFTRLNEGQLLEHLINPERFQGEDPTV